MIVIDYSSKNENNSYQPLKVLEQDLLAGVDFCWEDKPKIKEKLGNLLKILDSMEKMVADPKSEMYSSNDFFIYSAFKSSKYFEKQEINSVLDWQKQGWNMLKNYQRVTKRILNGEPINLIPDEVNQFRRFIQNIWEDCPESVRENYFKNVKIEMSKLFPDRPYIHRTRVGEIITREEIEMNERIRIAEYIHYVQLTNRSRSDKREMLKGVVKSEKEIEEILNRELPIFD